MRVSRTPCRSPARSSPAAYEYQPQVTSSASSDRFCEISDGAIKLTPAARASLTWKPTRARSCSATTSCLRAACSAHQNGLGERPSHAARASRFLEELEDHMSDKCAERMFNSVVNSGRYGKLFAYEGGLGDSQP
jgi:NitT/TauT family transport system ATP-binding protein